MDQKAFLGMGFDPEEVPIDIVPLHLLGRLHDFSLLVVDEFARFNNQDGSEEVQILEEALDRLDGIYGKTDRIKCSDFMSSSDYKGVLKQLQPTIEANGELRNIALKTIPDKYRDGEDALDYPINEAACVAYLYLDGFKLKLGPDRERKYDKLIRVLNENGRYGFREFFKHLEFAYTLPAFSLSGKSVVPYTVDNSSDRIFLDDSEQDVIRKLRHAGELALRYFATIGCVACNTLGKHYDIESIHNLDKPTILDTAIKVLVEGILRPYNRSGGLK